MGEPPGRSPNADGDRDGGGPPRGVDSDARVGGGTNARRAMVGKS